MKAYKTIKTDGQTEIKIKKSRFICSIKRVQSEEEAREFIQSIKKEHYEATHNCSAFIVGENSEIKRSSDDGEPSGTAGIPMLTVLENHELTNLVVVVTRYFGGIKLGAGGLIRSYAGAVAEGIKAIGSVQVKEQEGILLKMSYSQYQDFGKWCTDNNQTEYNTTFLEDVVTTLFVDLEEKEAIKDQLIEYFYGKIHLEDRGKRVVEVPIS
ncbi:YigZ family protein [Streptococcus sp. X16XC17]|uniref:YigZ family protein n=1 Tax=unclassified Streptococcus TaxID=2608887 RepID=UPI00066FEBE9|nr:MULTISPECIES: YigZ family protein [unclassified Streptococcus]TCD45613.1 YigZ family protein [Streptococcus sp. X16XC17]